jgi:hypothetical protein
MTSLTHGYDFFHRIVIVQTLIGPPVVSIDYMYDLLNTTLKLMFDWYKVYSMLVWIDYQLAYVIN